MTNSAKQLKIGTEVDVIQIKYQIEEGVHYSVEEVDISEIHQKVSDIMEKEYFEKGRPSPEFSIVRYAQNGTIKHMAPVLRLLYFVYGEIPENVTEKLEQEFYYGIPDLLDREEKIAGEAGKINLNSDDTYAFVNKCCKRVSRAEIDLLGWRFIHSSYNRKKQIEVLTFNDPIIDLIEEKKDPEEEVIGVHSK